MDNCEDEISEYELLRQKNLKELQELMSSFETPEFNESIGSLNSIRQINANPRSIKKRKRKNNDDVTFHFAGKIPVVSRKSARLSNVEPQYSYDDLSDDDDTVKKKKKKTEYEDDDLGTLEEIVYRRKRSHYGRKSEPIKIISVEEITEKYIANIADRCTIKIYSQDKGTSCHQCRQKTLDSKTHCRSGRCVGVRGQFCGVCLKNRYGEDAAIVLKDPKWACPPCRGLCNCSICRTREGKRPTGILAPIAFRHGHKSVKDFLITLNGEGDYLEENSPKKHKLKKTSYDYDSHEFLLGFNENLNPVWSVRNICFLSSSDEDVSLIGFNTDKDPVMIKSTK